MSRVSIYVIKEISSSFLFIFSFITMVVWLSQALRNLEILSSDNVTISSFFFYTILLALFALFTAFTALGGGGFLGTSIALNSIFVVNFKKIKA